MTVPEAFPEIMVAVHYSVIERRLLKDYYLDIITDIVTRWCQADNLPHDPATADDVRFILFLHRTHANPAMVQVLSRFAFNLFQRAFTCTPP